MLDYSNVEFPFTEFPKGVDVTMFDNKGKKTLIHADYGVTFKGTDIIDLAAQRQNFYRNRPAHGNRATLFRPEKRMVFYRKKV